MTFVRHQSRVVWVALAKLILRAAATCILTTNLVTTAKKEVRINESDRFELEAAGASFPNTLYQVLHAVIIA